MRMFRQRSASGAPYWSMGVWVQIGVDSGRGSTGLDWHCSVFGIYMYMLTGTRKCLNLFGVPRCNAEG